MASELTAEAVTSRLEWLRAHYVPDDEATARAKMEDPAGLGRPSSFEQKVAQRLRELRALCELTRALHRR